jgi:integrase
VETALAAFIVEVDKNKFRPPAKITVKDFIEKRWIRDHVETNLAAYTQSVYNSYTKKRIIPALGDIKLDKVTPEHILDFYANLREPGIREDGKTNEPLSPATILKYHHILSSMFSSAVEWQIIEHNPCDRVKAPKVPKKKPFSLDEQQTLDMIKALANESLKYRAITAIAIFTGMRRGEILGLNRKNLNLANRVIRINQTCSHTKGGSFIQLSTKTESSERLIPFPAEIVPLLQAHLDSLEEKKNKCGDKWVSTIEIEGKPVENDLIFTQWNGKPMHPNSIVTWFNKFRSNNNLPPEITFHGLRHTNITLLLINGVDVGTVADNAGHANKSTTLNIYQGSIPTVQRAAADKIGALLGDPLPDLLNGSVNSKRKKKTEGKKSAK